MKLGISIATYDRPNLIVRCLRSVCDDAPDGSVILVTDDHGPRAAPFSRMNVVPGPGTELMVNRTASTLGVGAIRHAHSLRLLNNHWVDYVAFLDDDFVAEPGYFAGVVDELDGNSKAGMVGGYSDFVEVGHPERKGWWPLVRSVQTSRPYDNFVMRAHDLRELGTVDSRLRYWEDIELLARLRMKDMGHWLTKNAPCRHEWNVMGGMQSMGNDAREQLKLESAQVVLKKYDGLAYLVARGSTWEVEFSDDIHTKYIDDYREPEFDAV